MNTQANEPSDLPPPADPPRERMPLQFGLGSMMILVAACALVLGLVHSPAAAVVCVFGCGILLLARGARSKSDLLLIVMLGVVLLICLIGITTR
jgi:hypothetical protein